MSPRAWTSVIAVTLLAEALLGSGAGAQRVTRREQPVPSAVPTGAAPRLAPWEVPRVQCPTCLEIAFYAPAGATEVRIERRMSPSDPNPLVVRRFGGDELGPDGDRPDKRLWFAAPTALAGLPPRFPVRYRVVASYPDRGEGFVEETVTSIGSYQAGFNARLENLGKTVVFTWSSIVAPFAKPKHFQIGGIGGAPSSPPIVTKPGDDGGVEYEYRWTPATPGQHRFSIVATYGVASVGDWDLVLGAGPDIPPAHFGFTRITVPDCVLVYERAPHALALIGPFPAETLMMSLAAGGVRDMELGVVGFRLPGITQSFTRNGEHLRRVKNVGYKPVRLTLRNSILGTTSEEVVAPGEVKSYTIDLHTVVCAP